MNSDDPIMFNYLLYLWGQITKRDSSKHFYEAVSQYERQQNVIDELKRTCGAKKDNA